MKYTHVLISPPNDPIYRETVMTHEGKRRVTVMGGSRMTLSEALVWITPERIPQLRAITDEEGINHWCKPFRIYEMMGFCDRCFKLKLRCDHCGSPHRCDK